MTTIVSPICLGCTRYKEALSCAAFPGRIPDDILQSKVDHRHPHTSDQGILFAPKTPADAAYADQLFPKSKLTR